MTLANKINLILISVVGVVLAVAFWVLSDIEGDNFKKQIKNNSDTVVGLLRGDIERMFRQIHDQKDSLQVIVDKLGSVEGIKYVQVFDTQGYHVAATQHDLVGTKTDEKDMDVIRRVIEGQHAITDIDEEETFFELERHIPIKLSTSGADSEIINIIETEVVTKSKSPEDMREAENLLKIISSGVEQSARTIILTEREDLESLKKMADNVKEFGFFHDVFVFDSDLNVVAATAGEYEEPEKDPQEYKDIRNDVVGGKKKETSYERVHEGHDIEVKVIPVYSRGEGNMEIIGLVEMHILTDIYSDYVNALRLRMATVAVVLILILVLVLIFVLRKQILLPLREYSSVAQKVAAGDLSQRIENISNDEIGKFGEVFNIMVNNIRELDRLKSEFISVAAHQLRTPLSAVKWAVKMVMDGDAGSVNEEQKGLLDQGYKSNERMILLINDLLDVSRIEAGKFEYEFIEGSVEDLVDTTIQEFQQIVKHKSVNLKYFKPDVRLPKVKIDPLKLKMVIENLIDNAVKYTPPGGKVDVLFKYYRDTIEFVVADSGVGIPKDQVAQLFSKFFRAKNVIRMQTDGTGLGLFIAKRIVEKHGGIIWAESEEGKGTQMHFTIPTIPK